MHPDNYGSYKQIEAPDVDQTVFAPDTVIADGALVSQVRGSRGAGPFESTIVRSGQIIEEGFRNLPLERKISEGLVGAPLIMHHCNITGSLFIIRCVNDDDETPYFISPSPAPVAADQEWEDFQGRMAAPALEPAPAADEGSADEGSADEGGADVYAAMERPQRLGGGDDGVITPEELRRRRLLALEAGQQPQQQEDEDGDPAAGGVQALIDDYDDI